MSICHPTSSNVWWCTVVYVNVGSLELMSVTSLSSLCLLVMVSSFPFLFFSFSSFFQFDSTRLGSVRLVRVRSKAKPFYLFQARILFFETELAQTQTQTHAKTRVNTFEPGLGLTHNPKPNKLTVQ